MKFEEILPSLREGRRAKMINTDNSDYWAFGNWSLCLTSSKYLPHKFLSMICTDSEGNTTGGIQGWGIPTWAIMREWELVKG